MIVRHFLSWVRNASAGERADATRALSRAWLISDLTEDDRVAAEGALLLMLDDHSPLVRQAMSDVFATSIDAPPAIIRALADDQIAIALPILEYSPLLLDTDLVDLVAIGSSEMQEAIARRLDLSPAIAAAIAEVAGPMACLVILDRTDVDIPVFSLDRIAERHGHLAALRETLLVRDDLSAATRLALVDKLSESLAQFVATKQWLSPGRAEDIANDARERSRVNLAQQMRADQLDDLVRHLRQSGELTSGLVLRALLCGNRDFFEVSLVELSGLSRQRVASLSSDRGGVSLTALLERAGFPRSTFVAIRSVLDALHEIGFIGSTDGVARLHRQMVERVLTSCEDESSGASASLLILLRRFATEAAREEARLLCEYMVSQPDEMTADDTIADETDVLAIEDYTVLEEENIFHDEVLLPDEISANDLVLQNDELEEDAYFEEGAYVEGAPLRQDGFEAIDRDWMITEEVNPPQSVDNDDFIMDLRLTIRDRLAA